MAQPPPPRLMRLVRFGGVATGFLVGLPAAASASPPGAPDRSVDRGRGAFWRNATSQQPDKMLHVPRIEGKANDGFVSANIDPHSQGVPFNGDLFDVGREPRHAAFGMLKGGLSHG